MSCERKKEEAAKRERDEPVAVTVAPTPGLPSSCDRYRDLIYQIQSCNKLPQQTRDALRQGYEAMSDGWANAASLPDEARHAMARGCEQGVAALTQAISSTCDLRPYRRDYAVESTLPRTCIEYRGMIQRLVHCEKMPQQARDALEQSFETMEQGWAKLGTLPPEAVNALADGCRQATDALKQAAGAMCGW